MAITNLNISKNYSETVTTNGASSYDFINIPSGAKRIILGFNAVSTNGTSAPLLQLGSGAVATTGYSSSGQAFTGASTTTLTSTAGFVNNSTSATAARSGQWTITNVSGNVWSASHVFGDAPTNSNNIGGGVVTLVGVLDRVRITTVNGTDLFDAGSVTMTVEY